MNERMKIDVTSVEIRSPIWRVLSVAAFCGAFIAFGMYLAEQGNAEAVALVAVVAIAKIIGYWTDHLARLRPAGKPGMHVPTEVKNLIAAVKRWLHARPLVVCCMFGVGWGIATLLSKNILTRFFEQLYSPLLSITIGCIVGAVICAPEFLRQGAEKLGWTTKSVTAQNRQGGETND